MSVSAFVVLAALHIVTASPAARTPKKGQVVLAEVTTGAKKNAAIFTVSVGDCKRSKGSAAADPTDCGVVVGLKRGGSGKSRLEWAVKSGAILHPNDNRVIIGDDANPETQSALRWSPVVVGNANQRLGVNGLLITQETRGERSKRRHDLFLARNGKLDHAFTAREGRGSRTWSAMSSADIDHDGGSEIVLMLASTDDEAQADTWEMQVYGWRSDIGKIIARSDLRPAVKGAVIAMTRSVADARKIAEDPCAHEFLVMDSKAAELLADGQFVLAFPAPSKLDAELALEAVRACNPALSGAVKPLANGVDVDADFSNDD